MAKTADAVSLLKEWSTWLVGIETLAIGLTGELLIDLKCGEGALKIFGPIAISLFLVSICSAAHLLVALPAFSLRYPEIENGEDFLNKDAFVSNICWINKISLLDLVNLEMYPFLLGIVSFIVGLILTVHPPSLLFLLAVIVLALFALFRAISRRRNARQLL